MAQHWWDSGINEVITVGVGTLKNWRGDVDDAEMEVNVLTGDDEYSLVGWTKDYMTSLLSEIEDWQERAIVDDDVNGSREAFHVGFNSRVFDHPFYCARAGRLRKDPFPFGHHRKRLDLYRVCTKRLGYGYANSQDDILSDLGIEHAEDGITGKDVPGLYYDGEMEAIIRHCRADIKDMMEMFLMIREEAMGEFYDHYDVDKDANFNAGIDL